MKAIFALLLFIPFFSISQEPTFFNGLPDDLDQEKIIFLEHEKIKVTADKKNGKEEKYLHLRQTNHNSVIEESNTKLKGAALQYPFKYAFATPSTYESLLKAGYRYVLQSRVYSYEHLKTQPKEGELIVFEYYIFDTQKNVAFKAFELDEMKVYDSKLLMKRLTKALRKKYTW